MSRLNKSQKVLDLQEEGKTGVAYADEEKSFSLVVDHMDFDDMGSPKKITVTIQPGDLLNPEPEKPSQGIDPMDADTNGLSEVETEFSGIDDGYDIEQCPIRQTHPTHTWNRPAQPDKPMMCEGLS